MKKLCFILFLVAMFSYSHARLVKRQAETSPEDQINMFVQEISDVVSRYMSSFMSLFDLSDIDVLNKGVRDFDNFINFLKEKVENMNGQPDIDEYEIFDAAEDEDGKAVNDQPGGIKDKANDTVHDKGGNDTKSNVKEVSIMPAPK